MGATYSEEDSSPWARFAAMACKSSPSVAFTGTSGTLFSRAIRLASSTPPRTAENEPGPCTTHTPSSLYLAKSLAIKGNKTAALPSFSVDFRTFPFCIHAKRTRPFSCVSRNSQAISIGNRRAFGELVDDDMLLAFENRVQ